MLIISRIRQSISLLIQSIPSLRSRRSRLGRVLVMNQPFSWTTKRKVPHLHQFLLVIGLQKGWINVLLLRDVRFIEGLLLAKLRGEILMFASKITRATAIATSMASLTLNAHVLELSHQILHSVLKHLNILLYLNESLIAD